MRILVSFAAAAVVALGPVAAGNDRNNSFLQVLKGERTSVSPYLTLPPAGGEPFREIDGAATLVRTAKGVGYISNTRSLQPNAAHTNWFVAFNKPERCFERCACGLDDLNNPFAEVGVFYATGRVTDDYGQATFTGETDYGELPTGFDQVPNPDWNRPVTTRAEIHLVVRTHNDVADDPEVRESQLTTFNEGCGPDGCRDLQVSVHRSPTCKPRRIGRR